MNRHLKSLAIYYGYPSSTNYPSLAYDVDKVAAFFAQFDHVVLGGSTPSGTVGLENPAHGDHTNTALIISRARQISGSVEFYGYITIGRRQPRGDFFSVAELTAQIDAWQRMGATGVFADEAGFDFWDDSAGMRARQCAMLRHVRARGMKAAFNAWNPADLFAKLPDTPLELTRVDAVYYESYLFSEAGAIAPMQPTVGCETFDEYRTHIEALQAGREQTGVQLWAGRTTKDERDIDSTTFEYAVAAAIVDNLDALAWPSSKYSASGHSNGLISYHAMPHLFSNITVTSKPQVLRKGDSCSVAIFTNKGRLIVNFSAKNYRVE